MTSPDTLRTACGAFQPNIVEHRTGMVFETDPKTGQQICVNPGTVTWSSAWPPEACARILAAEAERDSLRIRLQEAERAVEAMREAAADVALTDCRSDFAKQWDVYPEWDSYAIDVARAIRSLATPIPATEEAGDA